MARKKKKRRAVRDSRFLGRRAARLKRSRAAKKGWRTRKAKKAARRAAAKKAKRWKKIRRSSPVRTVALPRFETDLETDIRPCLRCGGTIVNKFRRVRRGDHIMIVPPISNLCTNCRILSDRAAQRRIWRWR